MTKAIMIQGAGSNVGKSILVAGICRALLKRGHHPAPFKPQNMSNNAAVTVDGGDRLNDGDLAWQPWPADGPQSLI